MVSLEGSTLHGRALRLQVGLLNNGKGKILELMPDSWVITNITDESCTNKWGIPVPPVDTGNYNIESIIGQKIAIVCEVTIIIRV